MPVAPGASPPRTTFTTPGPPPSHSPRLRSPRKLPTVLGRTASSDISFLADNAASLRNSTRSAASPSSGRSPSQYAGTQSEWTSFRRGLDGRRAVPVRARPAATTVALPALANIPAIGGVGNDSPRVLGRSLVQGSERDLALSPAVDALLFGDDARQVSTAIEGLARSAPRRDAVPLAAGVTKVASPQDMDVYSRPAPNGVQEMINASTLSMPSGRMQAHRLASSLAREVGPHVAHDPPPSLTPRALAALSAPTDPSSAVLIANHQEILRLGAADVAPHQDVLNQAAVELTRQVGSHCTEQATILEYLRRHHAAVANTSRALLLRLQLTIGMYEELRQAMDGSLLQRFQDSLGDAFAALGDKLQDTSGAPGEAPRGRRGSFRDPAPPTGSNSSSPRVPRRTSFSRRRSATATSPAPGVAAADELLAGLPSFPTNTALV